MLIDLPNNLYKPCIERLEKSGLDTPIRNIGNVIFSFKSNLDYFRPENIFCLGSMAIIKFHHVKQGHLLHVGQCILYNVYVDQEGRTNIVANMLGRLTKTTIAQCLHLLMVA